MNILIISQNFWPENFQINSLAKILSKRNHQVTVLTGLPNYPAGKIYKDYFRCWPFKENWNGVKIVRVPLIARGKASNMRLVLNYLSFAFFACVFSPFLCNKKYDAILVFQPSPITQALPAILLRWLKKNVVFLWVQDLWPESLLATKKIQSKAIISCVSKLVSFIYKYSDKIMVSSQAFAPYIEKHGISADKILYFPNSVDDTYAPLSLLPAYNNYQLPAGFKIFFAGNIGSAQAVKTILSAAEILKNELDIKWIFAGEGSERKFLEHAISERGLQNTVFWVGSYPAQEMSYLFSLMDVLLITLTKSDIFSLTVPSKLQSYLACAKPILAAIDGEAARIIQQSGAGIAVPAEDAQQLAKAALELKKLSLAERQAMGLKGYDYNLMHFAQQKLLTQLEQWFSQEHTL